MIGWKQTALDDIAFIQIVTAEKSGFAAAQDADKRIYAAALSLDKPMNLSKPGRLGTGERERFVDLKNKKSEFFIVFEDDGQGNITILNVKHHLEQYP